MLSASASASPSESSAAVCEHCGTNTGLERINATKLNSLLQSLTGRLSRDISGNFFVEGSKTGKDTRHGQLGDLFSLMSRLEGFKTTMDWYITLHAPKEVVKSEKQVSINQNIKAVVAELVEQQVANRLRDLSIRCDRVEEVQTRQKFAEDRCKELISRLKKAAANSGNVRKAEDAAYDDTATKEALATLDAKIRGIARAQAKHEANTDALEVWQERQETRIFKLKRGVSELQLWQQHAQDWELSVKEWQADRGA
ncbi:hypothetical protein LTR53_004633 [Teratosphaeriaceae sp. CCFEE 6253]|nr:hypothetical protein LTR53_004633 [Teratosphaeriaceae sp. CCFEE 6253]